MTGQSMQSETLLKQATEALRAGQLQIAGNMFRQAHEASPTHFDALHGLGLVALKGGDANEAVIFLDHALNIRPDDRSCLNDIASAYVRLGKFSEAEICFRKVLELTPNDPAIQVELGNLLNANGRYADAEAAYMAALQERPDHVPAHINLGNVLKELGRQNDAESHCREALKVSPDHPLAHLTLGNLLQDTGRTDEAEAEFRAAIKSNPSFPEAHNNLGNLLHRLGRPAEAADCCREALRLRPDYARAMNNLGNALRDLGKPEEAEFQYRSALEINPDFAESYNNLAVIAQETGRKEEAEEYYRAAIRANPRYVEAYNHLGDLIFKQGRLDEASGCYRDALKIRPIFPECLINLGNALRDLRRPKDAEDCYLEALRQRPEYSEALNNLGIIYQDAGDVGRAIDNYRSAIRLKPDFVDAHTNLALGLLRAGQLLEGWEENEWRWKKKGRPLPNFDQPLWDGEPLAGKTLLLHAEQGFGDTIQFCRFASEVAKHATVVMEVQKPLVRLLSGLTGANLVVGQGEQLPPFDFQCPLMSVARGLHTTLDSIPANVPYLFADERQTTGWGSRLENLPGLKVGIAWAGNPTQGADRNRSITLEKLTPLFSLSGLSLISLQKGAGVDQLASLPSGLVIHDWMDECGDFADTAALVAALDLVITVDTSIVHLAGALGKPVWLLNRFDSCWRWLLDRTDSPWYPTLRQFRQSRSGDWDGVIFAVRKALIDQYGLRLSRRKLAGRTGRSAQPAIAEAPLTPLPVQQIHGKWRQPASINAFKQAAELHGAGKYAQAEEIARAALAADPTDSDLLNAHGVMLAALGNHESALSRYRAAAAQNPSGSGVWTNLGNALTHFKYFDSAIAAHRRAVSLSNPDALLFHNLGVTLSSAGQHAEAINAFTQALEADSSRHMMRWDRALSYLALGNLREGWKDYEARKLTGQLGNRPLPGEAWDGRPYGGRRLLLLAEQGFGDTIWAFRYLPHVKALGGNLTVECQPELIPLLRAMRVADEIIPRASSLPAANFHCHLCSLPGLFTPELEVVPAGQYLSVPELRRPRFRELFARTGGLLKVGIVWSGSTTFKKNHERAQPLLNFLKAFALPGVQLYSLQKGPRTSELTEAPDGAAVVDLAPMLNDFADTAAALSFLDLVIMTDSAVAHLAGALHVPIWVLLGREAHWLWLLKRNDSPWYPTLRLFRPRSDGDWNFVFDQASAQLMAMVDRRGMLPIR